MFNRPYVFLLLFPLVSCQKDPQPIQDPYCNSCSNTPPVWTSSQGSMRTYTSENWDDWQYNIGDTTGWLRTYTSENWDDWQFSLNGVTGYIRTYTSENWDDWQLTTGGRTINIRTYTSNDWDYWQVTESATGFSANVRTYTSEDFDHWEIYSGGSNLFDVSTYTSEDWDHWTFSKKNFGTMDLPQLAAVLFVPVYTSAIHQRGIDQ